MDIEATGEFALDEVRRRRAELRDALSRLEEALAAPAPGRVPQWAAAVRLRLEHLTNDFGDHIAVTEGPDGFYSDVVTNAPRLARAVDQLRHDHEAILKLLDHSARLVDGAVTDDDVADVRDGATELMFMMVRHRQAGSDLMWDAYSSDIGGET